MVDDIMRDAADAAAAVADAVTGPGTPDQVKVVHRDDRLTLFMRALSGPAVSVMLIAAVVLLSFGKSWGVWTTLTEIVRAQTVGIVAIILAACVGVVLWVAHVGKPRTVEVSAGPANFKIEGND